MSIDVGAGTPRAEVGTEVAVDAEAQAAPELGVGATQELARDLSALVLVGLGAALAAVWAGAVWTSLQISVGPLLHEIALFAHLACLVVSFGAVLTVDWVAALWMGGRRNLSDVLNAAANVTVPIWLGLAGLVISGMLLDPDSSVPLTWIKLALVLVVGLNGLHALGVHQQMMRFADRTPPRRLLMRGSITATVSQIGWWGAVVIGFLNSRA
jgi:hypothetical protein